MDKFLSAFDDDDQAPSGGSNFTLKYGTQQNDLPVNMSANPADAYKARVKAALDGHYERVVSGAYDGKPQRKEKKESTRTKPADLNKPCKAWMEREGWKYERVDTWNSITQRAADLLGMFDYLAFDLTTGTTIGVQMTSKANMSARRKKILEDKRLAWVQSCGWRVVVVGFDKGSNGRWRETVVVI